MIKSIAKLFALMLLLTTATILTAEENNISANEATPPIPGSIKKVYSLDQPFIKDFFNKDINGDGQPDLIWLIFHNNQYQLIYSNKQNRAGQYIIGDFKNQNCPVVILQPLDPNQGNEISIFNAEEGNRLNQIISFFGWNQTTLFHFNNTTPSHIRIRRKGTHKSVQINRDSDKTYPLSSDLHGDININCQNAMLRPLKLEDKDISLLDITYQLSDSDTEVIFTTSWKLTIYGWRFHEAKIQ